VQNYCGFHHVDTVLQVPVIASKLCATYLDLHRDRGKVKFFLNNFHSCKHVLHFWHNLS